MKKIDNVSLQVETKTFDNNGEKVVYNECHIVLSNGAKIKVKISKETTDLILLGLLK